MTAALVLMPFPQSTSFAEDPPEETWTTTTEGYLAVTLDCPQGTCDVSSGSERVVNLNVRQYTWDVHTSSIPANTYFDNYTNSAIGDAAVAVSGSDGSISTASLVTDPNGNASTTFTMGSADAVLSFAASTTSGMSGTAGLSFTLPPRVPETWVWDHDEGLIIVSLTSSGTVDMPVGSSQTMQAHVMYHQWAVERSNYLNLRTLPPSSSAAQGAQVSWSVTTGDGSIMRRSRQLH